MLRISVPKPEMGRLDLKNSVGVKGILPIIEINVHSSFCQVPSLEYSTGYQLAELHILVRKLNHLLNFRSRTVLKNVFEKYSEE